MTTPPDIERVEVAPVNRREPQSLFKAREKIFPKRATGFFRTLKWQVMAVTLAIYYLTPWIRWDRGPGAPDQAVLIDMPVRRFYFFFIEIWPQEFFYVAGLLILAGIGLFLLTSTVGRAWCGYTCPQTVWVDLFLVVERWIEGDRGARIKLEQAPWSVSKLRKRIGKHTLWILIGMATGGAWVFYFADAPTLAARLADFSAPPIAWITIAILTATTYVFGGLMREQVCTYMCPWPRIQAAMLDEDSLVVTYNDWRGEPRARHQKTQQAGAGDCIDCNQCVVVCPMGIDIRDGQQLECITCALCIDACDAVMDKVGRPRGLISYATLKDYNASTRERPVHTTLRSLIRPRTILYIVLWTAVAAGMLYALLTRDRLDLNVLHDRNPVAVRLSDGSIRNGYTVKILNMAPEGRTFTLTTDGVLGASLVRAGADDPPAAILSLPVAGDAVRSMKIYVTAPAASVDEAETPLRFTLRDTGGAETAVYDSHFARP
ncbi:cytochrome c oxidase accessory protein CcoG [Iodidimonas sp. SYSU 1G8]|uniref:cytochrome c oxidase accessory protein CcoG n=1 Tax=Iodidimonas sp. SYSU 1G8 TaxID=3133967 RepID=UPI0031FE9FD0